MSIFQDLKQQAISLGFDAIGLSDLNLQDAGEHLTQWLNAGFHGDMQYMQAHGSKRYTPEALVPGTVSIISVRMNYHLSTLDSDENLIDSNRAYIARYALGRDYHKTLRNRLKQLADWLEKSLNILDESLTYRVFCDSAPVMERAIAQKAGLGFIGKNSMLIDPHTGSFFLLGEIYINQSILTLTQNTIQTKPIENHCGRCTQCITACPTNAIIAPYTIDARLCIAYLTIEYKGDIPEDLRPLMGNRIFGCDDCQLVCPWNRFAQSSTIKDFLPRHHLNTITLLELFSWTEADFLARTEGSPLRRMGYECFLRNVAIGLGNSQKSILVTQKLKQRFHTATPLVQRHIEWALQQQA